MKAFDVQRRIVWDQKSGFALPNFTPRHWFECDVCVLHPTGYWTEYEVKLTKADFQADRQKAKKVYRGFQLATHEPLFHTMNKHESLNKRDTEGPNRFFFVAPKGLLTSVPDWAGLAEFEETKSFHPIFRVRWEVVKRAPRLHNQKMSEANHRQFMVSSYYRWRDFYMKAKA